MIDEQVGVLQNEENTSSLHALTVVGRPTARAGSKGHHHRPRFNGPGATTLIVTKLTAPAPPHHLVSRPRLYGRLQAAAEGKLTIVSAPSGFGKTVIAAEWLAQAKPAGALAWVSLDRSDNDASRFWAYVLAALADAGVPIDHECYRAIERANSDAVETVIAPIINALASSDQPAVLVLDDFHVITSPQIQAEVEFLINHLPASAHVMILTRREPPLPLPRWKGHGDAVNIGARELAFNRAEIAGFFTGRGLELSERVIDALAARLGGWPAALHMVSLWILGSAGCDPESAVESFAGSDSTIADYLTREVLEHLDAPTRRFLARTCILDRLTAPLCDALTGDDDAAVMLADLHRRQLFVEALDDTGEWYRYHQLFEELLQRELVLEDPRELHDLHRRAGTWLAAHGFIGEALKHRIAAADWDGVGGLLLHEALAMGTRYPAAVIDGWLSAVPTEVMQTSPVLLVTQAFVRAQAGDLAEAKTALRRVREMLAASRGGDWPEIAALVEAIEVGWARLDCDLQAADDHYHAASDKLDGNGSGPSPTGDLLMASAASNLWTTHYWHGRVSEAQAMLEREDGRAIALQLPRVRVNGLSTLALMAATSGRLRRAQNLAVQALDLAKGLGMVTSVQASPSHLAVAVVRIEQGEAVAADDGLAALVERCRAQQDRAGATFASLLMARAAAGRGDLREALSLLDDTKGLWPTWSPPAALAGLIADEELRLYLATGLVGAARAVYRELADRSRFAATDAIALRLALTGSRMLLAQGRSDEAELRLATIAQVTVERDPCTAVEALVLWAVCVRAVGDGPGATAVLDRAIALSQVENLRRPFLELAAGVRPILLDMDHGPGDFARVAFRQNLLEAMGVPARYGAPTAAPNAVTGLSERELTVLRLLGGSLSNNEIATTLSITTNTLKTHIKHIFAKLGATDRSEAFAVARQRRLV